MELRRNQRCAWCGQTDKERVWLHHWVHLVLQDNPVPRGPAHVDAYVHSLDMHIRCEGDRDCYMELQRAAQANNESVFKMLFRLIGHSETERDG